MKPTLSLDLGESDLSTYNATRLLPYLIIGSKELCSNEKVLLQENVGSVINCTALPSLIRPERFKFMQLNLTDRSDVNIQRDFSRTAAFIESAKKKRKTCFVYCSAGQSRSATIVLAYLMQMYSMNLRDALSFVQSLRPQISPNTGFMQQLVRLEISLFLTASIDCSMYDTDRYASAEALSVQIPLNEEIQEVYSISSSIPVLSRGNVISNRIGSIFGNFFRKLRPARHRTGRFFSEIEPSPLTQVISPTPNPHPIAQNWF
mmetsp:Transcript_20347/g.30094  ORF Transcript_20347/g.30094 Transcript_20347/m.30094 type:complete len:261 (-) Transcript_20347:192-974(-)